MSFRASLPRVRFLDALLGILVVSALAFAGILTTEDTVRTARLRSLVASGEEIRQAVLDYRGLENSWPASPGRVPGLSIAEGDARVVLFASTEGQEGAGGFWAVLRHRNDPSLSVLVAETTEYPGHEGEPLRGVYPLTGRTLHARASAEAGAGEGAGARASLR